MIFKEISKTIESDTVDGWIYRFIIDTDCIYVKRVDHKDKLWSHGFLCQIYDTQKNLFVPQVLSKVNSCKFYGVDIEYVKGEIIKHG